MGCTRQVRGWNHQHEEDGDEEIRPSSSRNIHKKTILFDAPRPPAVFIHSAQGTTTHQSDGSGLGNHVLTEQPGSALVWHRDMLDDSCSYLMHNGARLEPVETRYTWGVTFEMTGKENILATLPDLFVAMHCLFWATVDFLGLSAGTLKTDSWPCL